MLNSYILVLLAVLILIILAVLYLFNKQLTSLRIKVNSLSYELTKFDNKPDTNNIDLLSKLVQENEMNNLNYEGDDGDDEVEDDEDENDEDEDDEDDCEEDDCEEDESCDEDGEEGGEGGEVEEVEEEVDGEEDVNNSIESVEEIGEINNGVHEIQMENDGNFSIIKKKVPNTPAKELDVNTQMLSENDNNTYEVVSDKNGRKRWKKIKV